MPYDLLITHARILQESSAHVFSIQDNKFIAVQGNQIAKIGTMEDFSSAITANTIIDGTGKLAIPGLVNTHTHAAMTLFRGVADDLPLHRWLEEYIFPMERNRVNSEMVYWCTKLAAAEMLLTGTTCVADAYFYEQSAAMAFIETGMRAVVAQGVIDYPAPGIPEPTMNIDTARKFLETLQGENSRITPGVFCHSPYTCSPETLVKAKELARHFSVPFFIHLSETKSEQEIIRERHKTTPTRLLDSLGLLDEKTICVHCVWLDEKDIEILAERRTSACTCPQSNMKLASGIAPVPAMLLAGMRVAIGTDGCASNNALDMFAEMKSLALVHKALALDATVMPASKVLTLATRSGAVALGLDDHIGAIAPGKLADIVLLDLCSPLLTPCYSSDTLVYAATGNCVSAVIIDGREVVRNGEIISFDLPETIAQVRRHAGQVIPLRVAGSNHL